MMSKIVFCQSGISFPEYSGGGNAEHWLGGVARAAHNQFALNNLVFKEIASTWLGKEESFFAYDHRSEPLSKPLPLSVPCQPPFVS